MTAAVVSPDQQLFDALYAVGEEHQQRRKEQ
jgi:hypothetical protein